MAAGGTLRRELGVFDATLLGLGSIVGTGVYVSFAVAAGVAGPAVVLAVVLAAGVATCNALSSAQLAASHPVSGGTYEYGYRTLNPGLGFTAGWLFLCAKTASAATAALGCAGYLLHLIAPGAEAARVPLAVAIALVLTALAAAGVRRSNLANLVIVGTTFAALLWFVAGGLAPALRAGAATWRPFFAPVDGGAPVPGLLHACALMFVAYTGYGRIATLGEEVREPRVTIPRAIIATLVISMLLYTAVAAVAVGAVGASELAASIDRGGAPLELVAATAGVPGGATVIAVGAVTAMLGVLLNLVLGLSRVVLAMARRGDLPAGLAGIDAAGSTPRRAVWLTGLAILALVLSGDIKTTWSFSAFTVLLYYAITNLAALKLSGSERLYPRPVAVAGLASCAFLAGWIEPRVVGLGGVLLAAGFALRAVSRRAGATGP